MSPYGDIIINVARHEIMVCTVGYSRQSWRGVWTMALSTIYYGTAPSTRFDGSFLGGRSGRTVLELPEKISTPNHSISPVFSITYLRKMPQFAA
jgi:hypothetical protein